MASSIYRKAGLPAPFEPFWELADWRARGSLDVSDFCLLMHLVLGCKRGLSLPTSLTPHQVSGTSTAYSILHALISLDSPEQSTSLYAMLQSILKQ